MGMTPEQGRRPVSTARGGEALGDVAEGMVRSVALPRRFVAPDPRYGSGAASSRRTCSTSTSTVQISKLPDRVLTNAILFPSGDHEGPSS